MKKPVQCIFCGELQPSRAARKKHNQTCAKNVNRERNQRISAAAQARHEKWKSENPQRGWISASDFSDLFDDLPDGAFFAMAEEHGLQPEDFI